MIRAWRHKLRALRADIVGAIAVEAAIILPLFLIIGFGAIDASFLMMQNHKMEQGLTTAGDFLASARTPNSVEAKAKRLATTGGVHDAGKLIIPGWTEADVTIAYKSFANDNGGQFRGANAVRVVTLSSSETYQGFGLLKSIFGNSVTVNAQYEARLVGEI